VDARPHTICPNRGRYGIEVTGDDFAYDLVARNYSWIAWREFAFDYVEISAANSAGADLE